MEHHLQQQVAQLVPEVGHVAAIDRIGDLVGFLDGVRSDGREVLLQIPRAAAVRVAQPGHDGEQFSDVAHAGSRARSAASPSAMKSPLSRVSRWL